MTSRFPSVWHCLVLQAVSGRSLTPCHGLEYQTVPHTLVLPGFELPRDRLLGRAGL